MFHYVLSSLVHLYLVVPSRTDAPNHYWSLALRLKQAEDWMVVRVLAVVEYRTRE